MKVIHIPCLFVLLVPPADGSVPKLPISKETTYVNGPVNKDGYIDYEAALNDRLSKGIPPERNANVLLWKAFGPQPQGRRMPSEFFKRLGIQEPPLKGDYFIGLENYIKRQHPGDATFAPALEEKPSPTKVLVGKVQHELERAIRQSWTAKQCPQLAAWLAINAKPLALVIEATRRPDYYNPLVRPAPGAELIGAELHGVQQCRELAIALAARAMRLSGEGKHEEAWQDLLACHRLGRLIGRGGSLIEPLVDIAIGEIAIGAMLGYLDSPGLTAHQVELAFEDFKKLPPTSPIADKMDLTDRCTLLDYLQNVHRSRQDGAEQDAMEKIGFAMVDWGTLLRATNRWHDRTVTMLRIKDRPTRQKQIAQFTIDLRTAIKESKDMEGLRKEIAGGGDRGKVLGERMAKAFLAMIPAFGMVQERADRDVQAHKNMQLAFALALYQRHHGRYPAKLDELAPKYIAKVPEDVFSGKAIVYRSSANGYLLYSVGVNGRDEGGRGPEDSPPGDDLSVRMPLPALKQCR
jgi:hypothetical protein